jgi:H+-transporting ATPase
MTDIVIGLTSAEVQQRLLEYGPNVVTEEHRGRWRHLLGKLSGPIPWMLEAVIILQFVLAKYQEALIITLLLLINGLIGFIQEAKANRALALLKRQLTVNARVCRDGQWKTVSANELVPGDILHLRMGDLSPVDLRVLDGQLQIDQSALTGESLPLTADTGTLVYAGAVVQHGEATGEVTATGARTYFGKTAELIRTAKAKSHLESTILAIVRYLVILDMLLIGALMIYAGVSDLPLSQVLPFTLILLVASVPVALPATFTLATALGAQELAKQGVLVTRLAAIEDAAAMDVLASDKTGTLTENRLTLAALMPQPPFNEDTLLKLAALACEYATQDPIDLAIFAAAQGRNLLTDLPNKKQFIPFDSQTKRAEAIYLSGTETRRVLKGSVQIVTALCTEKKEIHDEVEHLAKNGYRILAVADGVDGQLKLVGLLAFQDPPRLEAPQLIKSLRELGIRVLMVTGDGLATARAIASRIGLGDQACTVEMLDQQNSGMQDCDVYARFFPEDKFRLVQMLQSAGHIVGMTGDGVNDAPALKQAEVGFAVANATDVAKASASVALTRPGLDDVMAVVKASRRIHQRMLTYTLNKIIKTLEISLFLSLGLMLTGVFVVTPLLMVLLLFTNDFVTMSLATDQVSYSNKPDRWKVRTLMVAGGTMATCILVMSFSVFFYAKSQLGLSIPQLQTLMFLLLVFSGQGTVYLVRERKYFWSSTPSPWLLIASCIDLIFVSIMATYGFLMAPLPFPLIIELLVLVTGYLILIDLLKVRIFSWSHTQKS